MDKLYRLSVDDTDYTVWMGSKDPMKVPATWERVAGWRYWWAQLNRPRMSILYVTVVFAALSIVRGVLLDVVLR